MPSGPAARSDTFTPGGAAIRRGLPKSPVTSNIPVKPPALPDEPSISAEAIAAHFDGLSKLQRATVDDLSQVDGIDSTTAAEVRETLARVTESAILDQYN